MTSEPKYLKPFIVEDCGKESLVVETSSLVSLLKCCIDTECRNCNNNVTPTGSELFTLLSGRFAQISSQVVSIRVKKPGNTNFVSSRHIKREKASLPVDVRRQRERQKNNRLIVKQNNKFARASGLFVHFFAASARLRRENA